jgi:hypothetical protein
MIAMSNLHFYKYTINVIENMKGQLRSGQSRVIGNIEHTRHRTKTNKTNHTTQKLKGKMSNTDPTKNRVGTYVFVKSKQFLLLIRHPPSYSYKKYMQRLKNQSTINLTGCWIDTV